jgi:hypothetical protein
MPQRYVKDREDDILPRSMKALAPNYIQHWAGWMREDSVQNHFLRDGIITLVADRSRVADEGKREQLLYDSAEWFHNHGLDVQLSSKPDAESPEKPYKEVYLQVKEPTLEKATKLSEVLQALADELNRQMEKDQHAGGLTA